MAPTRVTSLLLWTSRNVTVCGCRNAAATASTAKMHARAMLGQGMRSKACRGSEQSRRDCWTVRLAINHLYAGNRALRTLEYNAPGKRASVSTWTLAKDEQHCQPHPFTRVSKRRLDQRERQATLRRRAGAHAVFLAHRKLAAEDFQC